MLGHGGTMNVGEEVVVGAGIGGRRQGGCGTMLGIRIGP